jgi:tellurium resistance protein TerD
MSINLSKGQRLDLSKTNPTLTQLTVGLGWNPRRTTGKEFDLDATAFLVKADGKVRTEKDIVFYNKDYQNHASGAVRHGGDNRDGQGDGDDEKLFVNLTKLPADIDKVVIAVSIFAARKRRQNFGMVDGAYVRLVDESQPAAQQEILRYDLSEDASSVTAMIFARLYRKDGGWRFEAVGQGFEGGLARLCQEHGIAAEEEQDD